jgi:hypothetical protein
MDVAEGGSLTLFISLSSLSDYSSEKGEFAFGCSVVLQDLMVNIQGVAGAFTIPASSMSYILCRYPFLSSI